MIFSFLLNHSSLICENAMESSDLLSMLLILPALSLNFQACEKAMTTYHSDIYIIFNPSEYSLLMDYNVSQESIINKTDLVI